MGLHFGPLRAGTTTQQGFVRSAPCHTQKRGTTTRLRGAQLLLTIAAGCLLGACLGDSPEGGFQRNASPIVNGQLESGFPAVVSLSTLGHSFCSGTLISEDVVLTAAHCLYEWDQPLSEMQVVFGPSLDNPILVSGVTDFVIHPDFDRELLYDDAALIRLSAPVDIEPVVLNRNALDNTWIGIGTFH
ncbi:MAG: trypsin-like serine protease, partial [Myxococcales bacterium]|nr:trypsin-like serine protease [Myxococcales bacterium]